MYVMLTKNINDTWDAFYTIGLDETVDLKAFVDSELEKGVPLVGMNVTAHKTKAVKGAIWNGSSFSGGVKSEFVPLDDDEFWKKTQKYSFLSDNKIVFSFTMPNDYSKIEMLDAAFSGEVVLVKNLSKPVSKVGKTFTLNGLELTLVEPQE